MAVKIGIPRALLFYTYFPFWKVFFENLGAQVITSKPTTKAELQKGVKLCVDEACLPIKIAFGHIAYLKDKVDYIFIPRLVSVSPKEYICPKFLGFPDMVASNIKDLPLIIDNNIDLYKRNKDQYKQYRSIALHICSNPYKIAKAYKKAISEYHHFISRVESGIFPDKAFQPDASFVDNRQNVNGIVALLGHPYCTYDKFINMNLIQRLETANYKVITSDNVPAKIVDQFTENLSKKLFWTLGRKMMGSAYYFIDNPNIDGIIHISSFACGPDSMTGELIERRVRQVSNKPFLNLVLDEHTGEAGLVTRIEAFLDMLSMRTRSVKLKVT